jgi:hypothetical protein
MVTVAPSLVARISSESTVITFTKSELSPDPVTAPAVRVYSQVYGVPLTGIDVGRAGHSPDEAGQPCESLIVTLVRFVPPLFRTVTL